jgi:hypothetical protein
VFSERLDATFLYAGIDLLQSDLLSGHMGRQIKGRITIHEMRPYSNGTRAQRDAWEELVLGIEALLPLGRHPEGSLEPSRESRIICVELQRETRCCAACFAGTKDHVSCCSYYPLSQRFS